MTEIERPRVGTGLWIRRNGKILFGKRISKAGYGQWCPPGGKLELNEEPMDCAIREMKEEAGVEVENVRFVAYTSDIHPEDKAHYITLHFVADWKSGEAQLLEPDKFEKWDWFDWNALPQPMFLSARNFIEKGYNPFDL